MQLFRESGGALIFDMDGVVVNSMPVHQVAWERYLERLGIDNPDILDRMHGQRNDEIVRMFLGPDAPEEIVHEHGAAKERLYRELLEGNVQAHLVPGIESFLDRASSVSTALATNAEPANVNFVLDGAGLRQHFQVIADGTSVSKPKPSPDIYLYAARQLGVEAGKCVVFEDSPIGVQAARQAGMTVVGVLTHSDSLADTDFSIKDFLDPGLRPWLLQHFST